MNRFVPENSLSLVVSGLYLFSLVGQIIAGYLSYNEEQQEHGQPQINTGEYMLSGSFFDATFENRESEFLSIRALVLLSIFLRQKGSVASRAVAVPHYKTRSE
jgi:uncharacterized protein involved in cysteine biosynthesis